MKKIFLAVIAVIVVLAGGLMLSYNGLAGSKEAVETAEADVDTDCISKITSILVFESRFPVGSSVN